MQTLEEVHQDIYLKLYEGYHMVIYIEHSGSYPYQFVPE